MLQRAAGLPVVAGHPKSGVLDSNEYAARTIGSVVLPYARNGELWGIARIMDADAAAGMASGDFSTSPGVAFRDEEATKIAGDDGALLIEDNPGLLDHVAVVPRGVWDKGGPATGIRNDCVEGKEMAGFNGMNETSMDNETEDPTETVAEPEPEADPQAEIMKALDALTKMCSSLAKDVETLKKAPKPRADNVRRPKTDAVMDAVLTRKALADAQARCDEAARLHGLSAAPPMTGETVRDYRLRLLGKFQQYSKDFKDIELSAISDEKLLDPIEARIYADAIAEASSPASAPAGMLREVRSTDEAGRIIRKFVGHPGVWLADFKAPKRLGRINRYPDGLRVTAA